MRPMSLLVEKKELKLATMPLIPLKKMFYHSQHYRHLLSMIYEEQLALIYMNKVLTVM